MRYFGCNGYLVVAESFKMAIGEYRRVFGEDPEEMVEKAGFGHNRYLPEDQAETLADSLHYIADNVEDFKVGDIVDRLRAEVAFVESSLADDPATPGVYDRCAGKWQPAAKAAEKIAVSSVDPDGWIEWTGGKCPVAEGTPVEVKARAGDTLYRENGTWFRWHWMESDHPYYKTDIVAYRVAS